MSTYKSAFLEHKTAHPSPKVYCVNPLMVHFWYTFIMVFSKKEIIVSKMSQPHPSAGILAL